MLRRARGCTLFPYTTLFRSVVADQDHDLVWTCARVIGLARILVDMVRLDAVGAVVVVDDRRRRRVGRGGGAHVGRGGTVGQGLPPAAGIEGGECDRAGVLAL